MASKTGRIAVVREVQFHAGDGAVQPASQALLFGETGAVGLTRPGRGVNPRRIDGSGPYVGFVTPPPENDHAALEIGDHVFD
jgi:hypothetical protein